MHWRRALALLALGVAAQGDTSVYAAFEGAAGRRGWRTDLVDPRVVVRMFSGRFSIVYM